MSERIVWIDERRDGEVCYLEWPGWEWVQGVGWQEVEDDDA